MVLIDKDRLLSERMRSKYYHLPNGDTAIPIIDIENAPAIEPMQWIPCSERMPEKDGYYLATCERFGWNAEKEKEIFTDVVELFRGDWLEPGKVVAWMPLPEPYKGGE